MPKIDFAAVGAVTNLKPPAARMRYTRLRRQIESGTLIGTHGTPFTGPADKICHASAKRKHVAAEERNICEDDTEDEEPVDVCGKRKKTSKDGRRSGFANGKNKRNVVEPSTEMMKGEGGGNEIREMKANIKDKEVIIKAEQDDKGFSSTDSDVEDSEGEIPLAKLRKARLGILPPFKSVAQGQPFSKPSMSPYSSQMVSPVTGGSQSSSHPVGGEGVPRSMSGFTFGQGAGDRRLFVGLGSELRSPIMGEPRFGNGHFGVDWEERDWARWERVRTKDWNGSA